MIQVDGNWQPEELDPRTVSGKTYQIRRYRPRIEGLFARIERWTNVTDPMDTFWRSISKDNITTWYGKTDPSRITDPADASRISSWLIRGSYDDKGNVLVYDYKLEDSAGVDLAQANERNRNDLSRSVNRYLKRIRYGNRVPFFPIYDPDKPPTALPTDWMFEVVFDYGEHNTNAPQPDDDPIKSNSTPWPVRHDPSFSSYRACFEVRTYRLCQRVLMFHDFAGETSVGADCLVRSTDFNYSYQQSPADARNPIFSFVLSVRLQAAARWRLPQEISPPGRVHHSEAVIQEAVRELDWDSLESLPVGLESMGGPRRRRSFRHSRGTSRRLVLQAQPEPDQCCRAKRVGSRRSSQTRCQ